MTARGDANIEDALDDECVYPFSKLEVDEAGFGGEGDAAEPVEELVLSTTG